MARMAKAVKVDRVLQVVDRELQVDMDLSARTVEDIPMVAVDKKAAMGSPVAMEVVVRVEEAMAPLQAAAGLDCCKDIHMVSKCTLSHPRLRFSPKSISARTADEPSMISSLLSSSFLLVTSSQAFRSQVHGEEK